MSNWWFPALLVAVILMAFSSAQERAAENPMFQKAAPKVETQKTSVAPAKLQQVPKSTFDSYLQPKEEKALAAFAHTLAISPRAQSPQRLLRELRGLGLHALVARDFNADTGKMVVVRTKNSLPGTRYFQAQYFEGADKKPFLQHMSFELRPGPDSMAKARALVEQQFASLGAPVLSTARADFLEWKLGDYTVWVNQTSAEDLRDDPHNAYDPVLDAGTVRVAVELNPHAHGETEHLH